MKNASRAHPPVRVTAPARRQAGFSFFEVLIAALILGIGVLGFAGLQVRALDTTGVSHFRAQAAVLAADLSERVRMVSVRPDLDGDGDPDFDTDDVLAVWAANADIPAAPPTGNDTCIVQTGSQLTTLPTHCRGATVAGLQAMVRTDVLELRFLADQLLPGGTVDVRQCDAGSTLVCVFLGWRGQEATDCELGGGENNCLSMQVLF